MWTKIGWLLALAVLAVTGFFGFYNALNEWPVAATPLQRVVTGGVLGYGVSGSLATVGLALRRRWSLPVVAAWGVIVTIVGTLANEAYVPNDVGIGATIGAGAASAIIAALVYLLARRALRRPTSSISPSRRPSS